MIFDALIVGETPAAMVAAALLVRKKLQVAWIVSPSHATQPDGGIGNPKVPDIVWDLLPRELVQNALERLGVPFKHIEKERKMGSGIQVVCPEFRTFSIDGPREFRRELKRIFALNDVEAEQIVGKEGEDVTETFLSRHWGSLFKKTPVGKKRTFPSLPRGVGIMPQRVNLEGLSLEPPLKRLIELISFSQSYVSQWVFPGSLVRHHIRNFTRLNIFAQGRLVSPDRILTEVFQMGGGEIFPGEADLHIEPRREKGISLWINADEVLNGTVCLLAVSPDEAPKLFEDLARHPRRIMKEEMLESVNIAHILFETETTGLPGGMGENLILYLGRAKDPFMPEKLAFLSFEKMDTGTLEGHYSVFYEGDFPKGDPLEWAAHQIQRLKGLFPFMPGHLTSKSVIKSDGHPLLMRRYYYETTRKRRIGVPKFKEGLLGKNLRYIGRQQLDYLGLEGEIITGIKGAEWAIERLSKI